MRKHDPIRFITFSVSVNVALSSSDSESRSHSFSFHLSIFLYASFTSLFHYRLFPLLLCVSSLLLQVIAVGASFLRCFGLLESSLSASLRVPSFFAIANPHTTFLPFCNMRCSFRLLGSYSSRIFEIDFGLSSTHSPFDLQSPSIQFHALTFFFNVCSSLFSLIPLK